MQMASNYFNYFLNYIASPPVYKYLPTYIFNAVIIVWKVENIYFIC